MFERPLPAWTFLNMNVPQGQPKGFRATVQARRWCEHCREWTERRVHPCSYRTVHAAGFRWMSNDMVNLSATVIGAAAAVAAGRVAS